MTSHLDQMLYSFTCKNPQCGNDFQHVLRSLLKTDEVICPKCGTTIDIRKTKTSETFRKALDIANQLDKQAMKKD